jgi:hypothetical protein
MKILFLTYLNRSGSTYLGNQLSKSPEICVCQEADILYNLFLRNPLKNQTASKKLWAAVNKLDSDKKFSMWKLNRVELFNHISSCQCNFEVFIAIISLYLKKNKPSASVILFKDSRLIKLISKIPELYKKNYNLSWISIIRDIRAIFLSQSSAFSPITGKPMCANWYDMVKEWNSFIKQSYKYSNTNYFSIIRYEDLILDTQMVINNITAKINVNYQLNWISEKNGEIYELLTEEYRTLHPLIDNLPDKSRIYRWRHSLSPSKQYLFSRFCKKNLEKTGYYYEPNSQYFDPAYNAEIIKSIIHHYIKYLRTSITSIIK